MKPRERVLATLQHRAADRIPRFEIWIDALLAELGQTDRESAYVNLGQDCILLPTGNPLATNGSGDGPDAFGRVWRGGQYVDGVVGGDADLKRYSPAPELAKLFFDTERIARIRQSYPDHCLIFGTHMGPFTAASLAMGPQRFLLALVESPAFVERLLEARTQWCLAMYQAAEVLGAEVLVLADDAGHATGPMISPAMWRRFIQPCHRQIIQALKAPVLWHSDGNIEALLPAAIEAGIVGVHGLDPTAGMDLSAIKRGFGRDLALIGNLDTRVLFGNDAQAVRREVDRCLRQGAPGGGYMFATCNSICAGMNPAMVAQMFRYAQGRI